MELLLFILAAYIALATVISSIRLFVSNRRKQTAPSNHRRTAKLLVPRPRKWQGIRYIVSQLFIALIIIFGYVVGDWQPHELGFKPDLPIWAAIAIGSGIYYLLMQVIRFIARIFGFLDFMRDTSFYAMRTIWPRSCHNKVLTAIAVCIFNPWTEEILFRGVLIYALGVYIGSFPKAIALGLIINLTVHLYQGHAALISHAIFYLVVISILFSPLGMAGAIGFHIAGDVLPVVTFRKQMVLWKARMREERAKQRLKQ